MILQELEKLHWQALKAYLVAPLQCRKTNMIRFKVIQYSTRKPRFKCGVAENFIPESTEQQVSYDIYRVNSNQLSANEIKWNEYMKAFIKASQTQLQCQLPKKNPATANALKKAFNQWLDEINKERHKYFFLKMDGLQKAMTIQCGVNWKSERLPRGAKIAEKDMLDYLGIENFTTNHDKEPSKVLLLTAVFKQTFHPSLKGAKKVARTGHKLEEPLCCKLFQQVQDL
jgi:hypothetical protein